MTMPEMNPVHSSNVESVEYDADTQTVYVKFLNGNLYIYKGVQEQEYQGLLAAPSVGSYLHRNFRNTYPYERIG